MNQVIKCPLKGRLFGFGSSFPNTAAATLSSPLNISHNSWLLTIFWHLYTLIRCGKIFLACLYMTFDLYQGHMIKNKFLCQLTCQSAGIMASLQHLCPCPHEQLLLQNHKTQRHPVFMSADIMASLCGVRVCVNNFSDETTRPRDMLFFLKISYLSRMKNCSRYANLSVC